MNFLTLCLLAFLIKEISCSEEEDSESFRNETTFYTAAVVELNSPGAHYTDPEDIVDANLNEYLKWIEEAAENGVDILVFPEATLNYNGINSRENLSQVAVELIEPINDFNVSECDYSHNVILNELSFAAANASIYVLVNVVEMEACNESESCPDEFKLFNSNLVFDRRGCIVSRYRKFNLFLEANMNVTSEPEIATFETDFGVTFGHFVCFDLLFESPALELVRRNVSHFLYPSMWFSETPFLTSLQIQQGFSQRNNIVLISAGANSPKKSNTGSGIFVGRHGAVERIISWKNESRILIAEVPKDVNDPDYEAPEPVVEACDVTDLDSLTLWNLSPLKTSHPLTENFSFTSDNIKLCEFRINFTRLEIPENHIGYDYKLVSNFGTRSFSGILNGGEVHCAIVACFEDICGERLKNHDNLVPSVEFHSISINLKVEDDPKFLIMPTTLDTSVLPLNKDFYNFQHEPENEDRQYQIKLTQDINNLFTFGIYGRIFSLDSKITEKNVDEAKNAEKDQSSKTSEAGDDADDNNLNLKMTIYVFLMVVLSIITAVMTYRKLQHPYVKPDLNKRKSCHFN